MRLYLIGELDELPLHVVTEVAAELADAFGRVHGYRFVTRPELEALPGGREALAAWFAGDDRVFRQRTRDLQRALDAQERILDLMSPSERDARLRPRLLEAGHHPSEIDRQLRDRRRRGFRIVEGDREDPA